MGRSEQRFTPAFPIRFFPSLAARELNMKSWMCQLSDADKNLYVVKSFCWNQILTMSP